MKKLSELYAGAPDWPVAGLAALASEVKPGDVFLAVPGETFDGRDFLAEAFARGSIGAVVQDSGDSRASAGPLFLVPQVQKAASQIAASFYGHPTHELSVFGVTGTNGKTTIATLLYQLFMRLGHPCGLFSTVAIRLGEESRGTDFTTPEGLELQRTFREMVGRGLTHACMEVSSHGCAEYRIEGIRFRGAMFTNFTQDHLDYHGTLEAYFEAKKSFFDGLDSSAFAITNLDDPQGRVIVADTPARVVTYSLEQPSDYRGEIISSTLAGLELQVNGRPTRSKLFGTHNAANLLAVIAAATEAGASLAEVLAVLPELNPVAGRLEPVSAPDGRIGFIDYAHTPDAVENVLRSLRPLCTDQVLRVVLGCGGDRDRTKRPLMAVAAAKGADEVILTSDNPRSEDPAAILAEMEAGLNAEQRARTEVIVDRREAIRRAASRPGVVLVAGKGHETTQEANGVKLPFSDVAELSAAFSGL